MIRKDRIIGVAAVIAMLVNLPACSVLGSAVEKVADANDEAVLAAEFTLCYGASVGAIRRKYGDTEKSRIWAELCNGEDGFKPEPESGDSNEN